MRKALVIIVVIALLGVAAAYVDPLGAHEDAANVATNAQSSDTTATATSAGAGNAAAANASNADAATGTATQHASGYKDGTYQGGTYSNPYGDVQVSVTISGGKITAVAFDKLTADEPRSEQINNQAAPILRQETLTAQSANIDGVSGASFTSESYEQSLQSALDKAKA